MLRIGVIGAGRWGPNLIRDLDDRRTSRVTRVVDRNLERLEKVAEHFPHIETDTEAGYVLEDGSIDAVAIATPTITHYELSKEALLRGKHVLVEKPLARSLEQAEELYELARSTRLTLLVGHVFLYNPAVRFTKQIVTDGVLGKPYYMTMERTNLGPIRDDVNAGWDLGAHDIAIASYLLDAQPMSVSAMGGSWIKPGIEDIVLATLRYPKDILVHITMSWLNPRKSRDVTIVGDRRMLTLDDLDLAAPIKLYNKSPSWKEDASDFVDSYSSFQSLSHNGSVVIPHVDLAEPLRRECQDFVRCIETGETPVSDGMIGCSVVRVLEAVDRSLFAKGKEEPVGD